MNESNINEIARFLWKNTFIHDADVLFDVAEKLSKAGYRKQSNVITEFAERVKMEFYREFDEIIPSIMADKIDQIAKEMIGGE